MTPGFVILPDQGRLLDLGTFQAEVLAPEDQTARQFSLLRTRGEPPGFGPPLHAHRDAAEAFYVLEGEYTMFIEAQQHVCPVGTFVYVPRGAPHTFKVTSPGPGTKLNLFTPAAMVGYFEELAAAEREGPATEELLGQIAERNHVEILGPVPDTYL